MGNSGNEEMEAADKAAAVIARLKKAIRAAGGAKVVAEKAGIPAGTLTKNLSGDTKIAFETVVRVALALSLDVSDLFAEEGAATTQTAPPKALSSGKRPAAHDVDIVLLQTIGDRVHTILVECKQRAPSRSELAETGKIYNQLLKTVPDVTDAQMVEAVLPVLLERFRERVATAEPGSGKRSAS
ncbi:MAG: hypothetical protein DI537_20755 [Stutzerimonas stutzeri]|nr:MAG: hypothetical protein DI537_20755 [Stutzerimonas stutzeri]